jgi:nitroreductase
MEFTDLIRSRESVRNYDPSRLVSKETLERILDAGRIAPSACNYQPWKFLIISSSPVLEKVKASYNREWFKEAPHILVVLGMRNQAWNRSYDGYNSIETDVAIAMTHIILAAENEGVGSCWIMAYNPVILKEALNIKDDQLIFGITPLGYPKPGFIKASNKKRKSLRDIAEFL